MNNLFIANSFELDFPNIKLGKEGFLNSVQETGVLSGKEIDCKNAATEHRASKLHTY